MHSGFLFEQNLTLKLSKLIPKTLDKRAKLWYNIITLHTNHTGEWIVSYTIIIMSEGISEIEWEEKITANTQRGARSKATRWMRKHVFSSDYSEIVKDQATTRREYWYIH